MNRLQRIFDKQCFNNGYELVDGVAMRAENGQHFQIPPGVIKNHVIASQFVELRIDSSRFSVHELDRQDCKCPSCNGEWSKPILRHESPASLVRLPNQSVPSRGWGEDFWAQVIERDGDIFRGVVDNPLYEARLHGLSYKDEVLFHANHILAVHGIHRREIVSVMSLAELKELADWLKAEAQ